MTTTELCEIMAAVCARISEMSDLLEAMEIVNAYNRAQLEK